MKFYNLLSGSSPGTFFAAYSKEWILAWIGLLILIVAWMSCRKFLEDDFNSQYSILGGILYLIMVSFTGSAKWSLLIGIAGFVFGGWFIGRDSSYG